MADICSNGWLMTCAPAYERCRSSPTVSMPPKYASWSTIGTSSCAAAAHSGSNAASSTVRPTDAVGPDHAADESVLLDATLELGDGQRRILLREQRDADQSRRVGRAVAGQPVVVGGAQRSGGLRVLVQAEHEAEAREQHRRVDSFTDRGPGAARLGHVRRCVRRHRRRHGSSSRGAAGTAAATAFPRSGSRSDRRHRVRSAARDRAAPDRRAPRPTRCPLRRGRPHR